MKQLLFLSAVCLIIFSSCSTVKKLDRINDYDAEYTEITSSKKQLRFVELIPIGQPQFFENVKRLIRQSEQEGYVLFYENVSFENINDTNLRKLRRIVGFIPTEGVISPQMRPFIAKGYVVQPSELFKKSESIPDINADVNGGELVAEYEGRFGAIELTEKDWTVPLTKKAPKLLPLENREAIVLDYRNQKLATRINEFPSEKIVLIYGFKHLEGLVHELKKIDSTYQKGPQRTTENNPAFLQVLSGDSIRKTTTDYIIEDGYIDQVNQFMNIRLTLKDYYEFFNLNSGGNQYDIHTNSGISLKLSANYKSISVWFTLHPDLFKSNKDEAEKGITDGFNFGFGVVKKKWFHHADFRYIKGFYLYNTKDFVPGWQKGENYFQKPDLSYAALEGYSGYKFNPKFSLRSVTSQTERQLISVGSLIATAHYRFYQTKDEQSPLFDSIINTDNYEIGLNIGYYYNWIFLKSFYMSLGASPGLGFLYADVYQSKSQGNRYSSYNTGVFRLSGHVGLGYHGERFFAGAYANFSGGGFLKENIPVINTNFRNLYQLFIGYRLEVSKKLRANRLY